MSSRHVTETVTLQTYTLRVTGPPSMSGPVPPLKALAAVYFDAILRETEENLTDLLPPGYEVRISEWDAEEETPNERS